jgi:hypothetical protein
MSVHVSSLVYSRLFGGASIKLVALKLADHADDDGGSIYPSIARIAAECELSERQVQRIIRDMVGRGLLRVIGDAKGGRGHPTRYSFHLSSLSALPSSYVPKGDTMSPIPERVTSAPERVTSTTERVTPMSPEPSIEPSLEKPPPTPPRGGVRVRESWLEDGEDRLQTVEQIDEAFESFWKRWPSKVEKKAARKAFERVMREVDYDDFITGWHKAVENFAGKEYQGDRLRFVPHLSSWLNGERWNDAAG